MDYRKEIAMLQRSASRETKEASSVEEMLLITKSTRRKINRLKKLRKKMRCYNLGAV